MKRRVAAAALAILAFGGAGSSCAAEPSSYSHRQFLLAAERGGDLSARWSLAWLGVESGDLDDAWIWLANATPSTQEQSYLKAWTAWRLGLGQAAMEALDKGPCFDEACVRLMVDVAWDLGVADRVLAKAKTLHAREGTPSSYQLVLLAALAARNLEEFDHLSASLAWRSDPKFNDWRPVLLAMHKLRANL